MGTNDIKKWIPKGYDLVAIGLQVWIDAWREGGVLYGMDGWVDR